MNNCKFCDKEIPKTYAINLGNGYKSRALKFCSTKCSNVYFKHVKLQKYLTISFHNCPICNTLFCKSQRFSNKKYCSKKCSQKKEPFLYTKYCLICKKEIKVINPKQVYCSHYCRSKRYRLKIIAKLKEHRTLSPIERDIKFNPTPADGVVNRIKLMTRTNKINEELSKFLLEGRL